MATNFPSSLDAFTNPTSGDTLDNPPHDQQHADVNDAVEAIETALLDGAPLHIDDANERVGIGTTTPATELNVVTNGNTVGYDEVARFDVTNNADGSDYSRLTVGQVTENKMFVEAADETNTKGDFIIQPYGGNVGIGDTTPSYTLDVNGDINATGDVRVAGTTLGRGVVDYDRVTGGTNPRVFTAFTESDLSTITFTASAGRLYKATGIVHVFSAPSLCQAYGLIDLNGSNLTATYQTSEGTSYYSSIVTIGTFTASGSTTVKFQIRPNTSLNIYMGGSEGWLLLIEDIGPS